MLFGRSLSLCRTMQSSDMWIVFTERYLLIIVVRASICFGRCWLNMRLGINITEAIMMNMSIVVSFFPERTEWSSKHVK